jgi:hypothetical protein
MKAVFYNLGSSSSEFSDNSFNSDTYYEYWGSLPPEDKTKAEAETTFQKISMNQLN